MCPAEVRWGRVSFIWRWAEGDGDGDGDVEKAVTFGSLHRTTMDINHVVQLVGYTPSEWIIRNSWSPVWGEAGFIRLPRTRDCVDDPHPQDGTDCAGGPPHVTVCGPCGMLYDISYPVGVQLLS